MKIGKVENSSIKIEFELNVDFFMCLIVGVLIGSGLNISPEFWGGSYRNKYRYNYKGIY